MAKVVIFDPLTNRVKEVLDSVNTPDYDGRSDVLVNPIIPSNIAIKYLKVDGASIVAMDATEKAAIDKAESDAARIETRATAQNSVDTFSDIGLLFRALAKVFLSEINTLRAQLSLAPRTIDQVKTAMKNAINAGDVDV